MLVQFDDDKDNEDTPTEEASSRQNSQKSNESIGTDSVGKGALFIPLGWSRLQEGEFYAASDPEWQQFKKLSQDSDKLDALKGKQFTSSSPVSVSLCVQTNSPTWFSTVLVIICRKSLGVVFPSQKPGLSTTSQTAPRRDMCDQGMYLMIRLIFGN